MQHISHLFSGPLDSLSRLCGEVVLSYGEQVKNDEFRFSL